jgi:flagellar biosynthesis protein FlhB
LNNKGQVAAVMGAIVIIIFTGILLNQLSPTINEFRVENLNNVDNHDNPNNNFMKFLWYAFMPILWGFWILLSIFAIYITTIRAGGRL